MQATPGSALQLSVSIVLHNSSLGLLQRCLGSLEQAALVAERADGLAGVAIYLVDNASRADYRAALERELAGWPQKGFFAVRYLPQQRNRGFGAGHNIALAAARSDVHLVLNPDTELAEDALSAALSTLAAEQDLVLLSPHVSGPGGQQEFLCKRYPGVLVLLLRGFAPRVLRDRYRDRLEHYEMRDVCTGETNAEVEIASGCFMLAPRAALESVGGFDEDFFLYFEDFDLSLRLGARGRLIYVPRVRILHHGGYAARKGLRHIAWFLRSGLRFFRRHGWRWW